MKAMTLHPGGVPGEHFAAQGAGLSIAIRRKAWGVRTVLAGLRLDVADGEFVCVVGPSGCGKSTLLNLLGGLDRDFDGEIARGTGALGVLFQNPRLMPWLTVLDNVRLVLPADADGGHARELLAAMGLGDALAHFPRQLSGGMQRRVALARAFAVRPRLLLLDEPFVSLDAPVAARLRALLLERWRDTRPTVLFVTHDLTEALECADRVVFLGGQPARIVHELRIAEPRPRPEAAVATLRSRLFEAHPELLAGRTGAGARGEE